MNNRKTTNTVNVVVVQPGIYNGADHRANPFAKAGDIIAVAGGWYAEGLIAAGFVRYPDTSLATMTITVNTEGELILPPLETGLTEGEIEPPPAETDLTKLGVPVDTPEAVELLLGKRRGGGRNAP